MSNLKICATHGFAINIKDETYLGLAMLIAESEDGHYEPIATVGTINEAREIASIDMVARVTRFNVGDDPMCPCEYVVWARGVNGEHRVACRIDGVKVFRGEK